MPAAGTRQCKVCLAYKDAEPRKAWRAHHGIGGGLRCKTCANPPSAERRLCGRCGLEQKCTKAPGAAQWHCASGACAALTALRRDTLPPKLTSPLTTAQKRAKHLALLEIHYGWRTRVDLWIVPMSPWCCLLTTRLILWRRFNVIAAVLLGPPKKTFQPSAGQRAADRAALAFHFRDLVQNSTTFQFWPAGSTPVLVTGTTDADLGLAKLQLPVPDRTRLKAYPRSLSEWMTTEGWSKKGFNQDPTLECVLTLRAKDALQAAGMPSANAHRRLGAAGPRGGAFRALYAGHKP